LSATRLWGSKCLIQPPGPNQPRNARFWLPLIALFSGMRLDKICQLDVVDVRLREGVACFVVTTASDKEESDKRLQTASSERFVPVHPTLLNLGMMKLIAHRRDGMRDEVVPGSRYRCHRLPVSDVCSLLREGRREQPEDLLPQFPAPVPRRPA
jgi:integrase